MEAVTYRYKTGIPWRDLVILELSILNLVVGQGVWEKIFKILSEDANNEYTMIDSTIVRAHQHSVGAKHSSPHQEDMVVVQVD